MVDKVGYDSTGREDYNGLPDVIEAYVTRG